MKGDFSRIPFAPGDNITRVLLQQGRPLVEADLNEALMALVMNQRKIIRLLRNDGVLHHGAFKDAFLIRHTTEGKLQVDSGDYRFDDILLTNPARQTAQSYVPIGDRWVVRFDDAGEGAPKSMNFVVGLVAIERPMLIGQQLTRAPGTGDLRAGVTYFTHWAITLEPYSNDTTDADADAVKQKIEAQNTFGDPAPPCLQVAQDQELPSEYRNRLWRLEIHSTQNGSDPTVELKLAIDNGSRVFGVKLDNPGGVQLLRFEGKLPIRDDFVEVESEFGWLGDGGKLHKIETPAQYREGIIGSSIAEEVIGTTAQVRVWNWSKIAKVSDLATGVQIGRLLVRLQDASQLRPRDGWSFRTDQIADKGNVGLAKIVFGSRQPIYRAVLGTAMYDGNGKVTVNRESYRQKLSFSTNVNLAEARPAASPQSVTGGQIAHVAAAIACRAAFPEVQTPAVKRWLASTTLGEILALSKDQLRQRIERDSQSNELDVSSFERDLNTIVDRRGQLMAKNMLV